MHKLVTIQQILKVRGSMVSFYIYLLESAYDMKKTRCYSWNLCGLKMSGVHLWPSRLGYTVKLLLGKTERVSGPAIWCILHPWAWTELYMGKPMSDLLSWIFVKSHSKREFRFNTNLNILNLSLDKSSISAFLSCCSWSLPIMFLISAQQPGFLSYITLKFQGNVLASNLKLATVFFLVWCLLNMIGLIVFYITAWETPSTSKGLHRWKIWLMVI